MSAFMHTDAHFAALSATFVTLLGMPPVMSGCVNTANALALQNRRSVDYRYEPGAFGSDEIAVDPRLIEHYLANPLTPAEFVKALDSYAYQSCETPDWQDTPAFAFFTMAVELAGGMNQYEDGYNRDNDTLRKSAAYSDADTWSIHGPDLPEPEPEAEPAPEHDALVVEIAVVSETPAPVQLPGNDADALVAAILLTAEAGEEQALTELANSHRGQMRRAAIALGLVTKSESRKLTRPVVADMLAKHVVRLALASA